ncbi:MAG TPA: GAF domain-containing protein [Stellaceae bacterium]|nr:GAF domain-containing protein [Stellaceae bacterium]
MSAENPPLTRLPLGPARTSPAPRPQAPRGKLFRKYVMFFVGLVAAALIVNGGFDFWIGLHESKAALLRMQQLKADAAAQHIREFVEEIEREIGWTTYAQWSAEPLDQRRFDYVRLLSQVPAITEVSELDKDGKEQLKVSRLAIDVIGSGKDLSQTPAFIEARTHKVWFSPVYFRKESEPYMTLAIARAGRNAGVTVAEVNLKLIWDVINTMKLRRGGYAYVVDKRGKLIAHPDISLVLRDTDFTHLPQVASALTADKKPMASFAHNDEGTAVLSAHAAVEPLGWLVFVEVPLSEAFAPLISVALRSLALLVLGLIGATVAALFLARRMTVPIRELQEGAAQIGAGDLDRRLDIRTGDELEALAEQFNRMAADLQTSYAELEQKVEERTAELSEALEYQTATGDVLQVISRSTFDLQPVLDTLVETAARLCEADMAFIFRRDGKLMQLSANTGFPPDFEIFMQTHPVPPDRSSITGRTVVEGRVIQIADIVDDPEYAVSETITLGKARTMLGVPLFRESEVIGVITLSRQRVEPFSERQIELVRTFADQAVIAIENTRLITETQEALEQQTATAEVLGVINSSPGDLAPVFAAILERAMRSCEAAFGFMTTYDGERFTPCSLHNAPEPLAAYFAKGMDQPQPGDAHWQLLNGAELVHNIDQKDDEAYRSGNPLRQAVVDLGGTRTALVVALRKDGVLRGTLTLYRKEVRPFTDKQIALVQNFAAQAVIAMENARLITETREALAQQTATAEVLGVINASPGDLAPVFDALLDRALGLCGGAFGVLWTYDGEAMSAAASRNAPPEYAAFLTEGPHVPGSVTAHGRLIKGSAVEHIADVAASEDYRLGDAFPRALVDLGKGRTILAVPLRREDVFLGDIFIYRQEVRPFTDKQIALLQNFAAQAVIAMENARLITETREALDQQTATAEVLGVINASPGDLAPVFESMLEKAIRLCDASLGTLWTYDGERMHPTAIRGASSEYELYLSREPLRPGAGALGSLVRGEDVLYVADLKDTDAYRNGDSHRRALVDLGGGRSLLGVALRIEGQLRGAFLIYRREPQPFTDKQITLLQNFAAQAVIAMENARLITETQEALDQQTATTEVLQVINSSPGELTPVFDAMLEKAMRLCEATFGQLSIYNGHRFDTAVTRGVPPAFAEYRRGNPPAYGPSTQPMRLLAGERVIHDTDLKASELYEKGDQNRRALVDLGGARTSLMVALAKDEQVLGFVHIYRQEVRPFSDKQIALLQNFAAQAVIAMENARLMTETQEALDQQTATAEVLGVINASPGDLAPVFDAMLERAMRLCEAAFGMMHTYDGQAVHPVAVRGLPARFAEFAADPLNQPGPGGATPRLAAGAPFVHVADLMDEEAYRAGDPYRRALVDLGGARTLLAVALRRDGIMVGQIAIYRTESRAYADKQIALLQNFAAQAVIAMENARLITETQEALDQQTATAEVLQVINASPGDLAPVFDAMLEKAMHLCEATFGTLWTWDGECMNAAAVRGASDTYTAFLRQGPHPPSPIAHQPLLQGVSVVHIDDIAATEGYRSGSSLAQAVVELGGVRTLLAVPLRKDAAALLGVFSIYRDEVRPFSDKQIALLQNFAAQAVIAMENARLITETREALDQQTATAEVLGVINSSPGELAPVFDVMLEKATRLCEATHGNIWSFDGEQLHAVAVRGDRPFTEWLRRHNPVRPFPGTAADRIARGERLVHLADRRQENAYGRDPGFRELVDTSGVRASLSVALRKDEMLLGMINVYRQEVRPFTDKQIALLQNFAAQAVIAMENARLITETREARDAAEGALRDLKAAQGRLIQAEKMASLGQLTAGIAHEIKNPLNFVNNFAALSNELLDEVKETAAPALATLDDDKREELDETMALLSGNLQKIAEHGRRADNIVKSMLEHSRGVNGERREVDLNALVEESLNLAYHGARAQDQSFNITLERDFDARLKPVELVPQDMTRVFLNLFGNGFYAAAKRAQAANGSGFRPVLHVATREAGDAVEVRVRDNGTGIPADIRDKLFQPFFTTKPTGEGTGLGLSISYDIVTQQHGGTIAVASEEGNFTEFTIRLPRAVNA